MNQQEKLASLSAWMVGAIVFVVLILATVAIFGGQSGDATLGGQLQMTDGEGDLTIAQQLPVCPSTTPCMDKEFVPSVITYGETAVLSVTLVNTSTNGVNNIGFTDLLADGLELAAVPNSGQCTFGTGTVEGIVGGTVFTVSNAYLEQAQQPPLNTCTITVTVRATSAGTKVNDSGQISATSNLDPSTAYAELQVDPAPLTITADDKQMWQGSNPPPLTATYAGLIPPDTPADLDVPPVLSTPANSYSPAGLYPIFVSGASDPNYSPITYIFGTLTVYINRMIEKKGLPVYPGGFGFGGCRYYRLR